MSTPIILTATDDLLIRLCDKLEKQRLDLQKQLQLITIQLNAIQKEVSLSQEEETDEEEVMEISSDEEDEKLPEKKKRKL